MPEKSEHVGQVVEVREHVAILEDVHGERFVAYHMLFPPPVGAWLKWRAGVAPGRRAQERSARRVRRCLVPPGGVQ